MLTVRSKASADWLLIFSACMPLVAGLCCLFISLAVMLIIKTRSWRVSWWLSSLQIYFSHTSPCFAATQSWSRDKGCVTWLHHEISHARGDCVTDSVKEGVYSHINVAVIVWQWARWNHAWALHHVIVSRECVSTWHRHVTASPSLLASHSPLHSRSVCVWNKEIIISTLDSW